MENDLEKKPRKKASLLDSGENQTPTVKSLPKKLRTILKEGEIAKF